MGSSTAILIVDDSKFMRDYTHKSLKTRGYTHIIEAIDGKNALDVLMEHKVDLIISKLKLPKVNGLELLRALSNHSTLKHIPFVVLTPDTTNDGFIKAMKIGATDYIKKPFTSTDIDLKIKSVMQKS